MRILHPCQVDVNTGLDGGTEGCVVCSAASDEVKLSWVPKRTYAGSWDLLSIIIIVVCSSGLNTNLIPSCSGFLK